jgi:hypothetical protein
MNKKLGCINCSFVILLVASQGVNATDLDDQNNIGQASMGVDIGNTYYFAGIRTWAASWDIPMVDLQTVIVNQPSGPVVALQEINIQRESGVSFVPVLIVGARHGDFTISASYSPNTKFSTDGLIAGDVTRREADISIGYSFTPNIMGTIVYRSGKISQALTDTARNLSGSSLSYSLNGILAGVSANAPIHEGYSLYGNFGIGPAREKTEDGGSYDGIYTIGELGVARKIGGSGSSSIKSISLQVGYRFQNVAMRDFSHSTYSTVDGSLLSKSIHDVSSNTHGFVVGLVGVF